MTPLTPDERKQHHKLSKLNWSAKPSSRVITNQTQQKYRKNHLEQVRLSNTQNHQKNRDKQLPAKKSYRHKFMKTIPLRYLGVTICSKCGLKGYAQEFAQLNKKTGSVSSGYVVVYHRHTENGVGIYDGSCYIKKALEVNK